MKKAPISLLFVVLSWSGQVFAQSAEDLEAAQALDARARDMFQHEDYETALEIMVAAQALAPATSRLYNMGVCNERLGRRFEAIDLYEEFVEADDAPPERRRRAAERLESLRADDQSEPPEIFGSNEHGETPPGRHRLSPTPFWVLAGLTGALGLATIGLGTVTITLDRQWDRFETPSDFTQEQGQAMATTTDVLLGLTCASALAALVIAFFTNWGSSSDESSSRFTLAASPGPSGGSVALEIGF